MQRVVRSTLVGILTIVAAACGDKVTVPPAVITPTPTPGTAVLSVTVSPSSVSLAVGDKVTMAATVVAEAGQTNRGVTWSSSDATIASVDANGVVTAVKSGNTTIIAKSAANPTVSGAAAVSVATTLPTTVTISSINVTTAAGSVPANLGNVAGQIDVTLNVDAGSARLTAVQLVMNCTGPGNSGVDTVVAQQTIAANLAAAAEAEAQAPVTISFNTATFNATTGAPAFRNGACTIKARAVTAAGTQVASSSTSITLNNADVVTGSITATKSSTDPAGLAWTGGDYTVTVAPVFYTASRTPVSVTISFPTTAGGAAIAGTKTQTVTTTGGAVSATFIDSNDPASTAANNIDAITNAAVTATVTVLDNNGQNFTNNGAANIFSAASVAANPFAPTPIATLRMDTEKPATLANTSVGLVVTGNFPITQNTAQNTSSIGYINGGFRFVADSAAGFTGPDANACPGAAATAAQRVCNLDRRSGTAGVDRVTYTFQTRLTGSGASGWTTVTSASGLAETPLVIGNNTSYNLRIISTDVLGNADTTGSLVTAVNGSNTSATFGVDRTAPVSAFTAGELNQATFTNAATPGAYFLTITDNLAGLGTSAGPGTVLVAQTRQDNRTEDVSGVTEGRVQTNAAVAGATAINSQAANPCVIGRFNAVAANAGANAITAIDRTGATLGFCTPVPYVPVGGGPAGTTGIAADAAAINGYIRTTVVPTDMAGNIGTVFTSTILVDATTPTVNNIDLPPTITGNASTAFPSSVTDGGTTAGAVGDIVGSFATIAYPVATLQYPTTAGPGVAFDNVLTRTATVTPTIPNFILNLQQPAGAPASTTASTTNATTVTVSAQDVANNVGNLTTNVAAPISFSGSGTNFTGTGTGATFFTGTFTETVNNATVTNCPAAGCGATGSTAAANPTSTTISAVASGQTAVFNNPFTKVEVWYRIAPAGTWFLAGTAGVPTVTDSGVGAAGRAWTYTFTFDPPVRAPTTTTGGAGVSLAPANGGSITIQVMTIGTNANGDAVATGVTNVTLTNP